MPTTIRLMLWGPVTNAPLRDEHPRDHVELVRVFAHAEVSEQIPKAVVVHNSDDKVRVRLDERIIDGLPHTGYSITLAVKIDREPVSPGALRTLEDQVESAVCDGLLELVPVIYVEFVTSRCEGYGGSPESTPRNL